MKLPIVLAIASLTLTSIANADYCSTSTMSGNTTYHSCTWLTATSNRGFGGMFYHSGVWVPEPIFADLRLRWERPLTTTGKDKIEY